MGLKIKSKDGTVKLRLCTKAGNSPYNKDGLIVSVDADRVISIHGYRGGDIAVLRPTVDKLIISYNLDDCSGDKAQVRKAILRSVKEAVAAFPNQFKKVTEETAGKQGAYRYSKSHHHNIIVKEPTSGAKIVFQFDAKRSNGVFFKCECNPSRLGPKGVKFLKNAIMTLFAIDEQLINYDTIACLPNGIDRMDVAVDLLGVDVSDIEFAYLFKGKTPKTVAYLSPTARVQTKYIVKGPNDENDVYWYNKAIELKENFADPLYGAFKSPYGAALYTRIEFRIKDSEKPISKLPSFHNHLKKLMVRAADFTRPGMTEFPAEMFVRYALLRSVEKAKETCPVGIGKQLAEVYEGGMVPIWKAEEIWKKGWKTELEYLGLLP